MVLNLIPATRMGARAGEAFVTTGMPTRNPFEDVGQPELAQAWRRAYFDAIAVARAQRDRSEEDT